MAIDHVDHTTVTSTTGTPAAAGTQPVAAGTQPVEAARETVRTDRSSITRAGPGGSEMTRRIVVLVFGLIQIVIGARIVLLLLDAREGNGLVSGILNLSQIFVGPFEGILRTDALHSAGSTLDITAIVAIIGWSILELIVLWVAGIFRRDTSAA